MSKKSTKSRGSKHQQGPGAKEPAKFEGAIPASPPASAAKPAWEPRPRTADRIPHVVPAATAPAPDKGVGNVPPARAAGIPAPAPARAAAPTHEEIARAAHDLWAQRGRPQGQDIDIWCEAERRLARKG